MSKKIERQGIIGKWRKVATGKIQAVNAKEEKRLMAEIEKVPKNKRRKADKSASKI
jgi:hypothetical protein